jgi:hypothetical protein
MSDDEYKPWIWANRIMLGNGFSHELIWRSQIWAAKYRECPKCLVPPGFPCHNMSDVNRGIPHTIRANKWPHTERVDWNLLVTTLNKRGYW